jgi:hypothetical protein
MNLLDLHSTLKYCSQFFLGGLSRPLFVIYFSLILPTQFNIILLSSVLLSCCHIHTVKDYIDYGTLLSPELE